MAPAPEQLKPDEHVASQADLLNPAEDSFEHWMARPHDAFLGFLARHAALGSPLNPSSVRIYAGMFDRLCAFLDAQGRGLMTLDEAFLERFLASRKLSEQTRHRYLLLFTALYRHLQAIEAAHANPPVALLRSAERPERLSPEALLPLEVQALLRQAVPAKTWKHRRNACMFLTFLGAGLRVQELLGLTPDALENADCKTLIVPGARATRRVDVQEWAQPALKAWCGERERLAIPGRLVFPANERGEPLSPATVFRQARARLEAAGITRRYEGPTLLRNTYGAVMLATQGLDAAQAMLGHETAETTLTLLSAARIWEAEQKKRAGAQN